MPEVLCAFQSDAHGPHEWFSPEHTKAMPPVVVCPGRTEPAATPTDIGSVPPSIVAEPTVKPISDLTQAEVERDWLLAEASTKTRVRFFRARRAQELAARGSTTTAPGDVNAARGPWEAVLGMRDGTVTTWDDFTADGLGPDDVWIQIVRNTALPTGPDDEGHRRMAASAYRDIDVLVEWDGQDCDSFDELEARWKLAEAVAAVLNGASTPTDDHAAGSDPMPVFTLKGKDLLALEAVQSYLILCEQAGLAAQAEQVRLAFEEMAGWRERNPGAVKLPDHPHVPVAAATKTTEGTC
jgi:hypothetical protein